MVHNGQERLSASVEQPTGHVVALKSADLGGSGNLVIRYKEAGTGGLGAVYRRA